MRNLAHHLLIVTAAQGIEIPHDAERGRINYKTKYYPEQSLNNKPIHIQTAIDSTLRSWMSGLITTVHTLNGDLVNALVNFAIDIGNPSKVTLRIHHPDGVFESGFDHEGHLTNPEGWPWGCLGVDCSTMEEYVRVFLRGESVVRFMWERDHPTPPGGWPAKDWSLYPL